ncbi:retrovirus-related pol polyprotein from transposon TNT 1-94 [Tanacetum coccineum]
MIEAARTMLADSLLPTVFCAEAFNVACYVSNRVLVTKPHNKTPYELIIGRAPSISFMRPFGCPVTILNTLDPLGKFDGKAEEGFLVGYSINSKAFRGKDLTDFFDIDSLINSMNYPQETNGNTCLKKNVDAGQTEEENVSTQQYIVFPLWSSISSSYKSSDDKIKDNTADDAAGKKNVQEPASEYDQALKNVLDKMLDQEKEAIEQSDAVRKEFEAQCDSQLLQEKITKASSTNSFNTVNTPINTASASRSFSPVGPSSGPSFVPFGGSFPIDVTNLPHDPLMHELEDTAKIQSTGIFGNAYDDHDLETLNTPYADQNVGAEADFNNMEPSTVVSPIPTTRVHSTHPKAQIIGDPKSVVQTRGMIKKIFGEHAMISYIQKQRRNKEKIKVITVLKLKEEKDIDKMISMEKQLKELFDQDWVKHSQDHFRAPTAHDMEILIKTCLMPLALKTQNDNAHTELQCLYLHKVKECECLAQKLSKQTEFVSKEVYTELLRSFAKLEKHSISLELALQQCQEQMKNDTVCKEKASNVFQKEREQYFEIQDLKAQLQDKNIAISELKKLIEKCKGKSMETKFDKPSVVRQPNAQRIPKPSVLGKPAPFSDSLERKSFSQTKSVPKTNVSESLSKPVTTQILPQTARQAVRNTNVIKPGMYQIDTRTTQTRAPQLPQTSRNTNPHMSTSTGVIHRTNVSRPRLRSTQMKDKVMPNNSHVKDKKTEKSKGSEGFHQIIDFLNASHIQYALTENPTIYVSFIKQFWRTATARTSANGEVELTATIDGQVKTITEASLRRHLKLEDNGGVTTLPNSEIFEQLALMGNTISVVPSLSNKVQSLETELKETKQTYNSALIQLTRKVKKLEKIVKASKSRRRVREVESDNEEDLEDPSK